MKSASPAGRRGGTKDRIRRRRDIRPQLEEKQVRLGGYRGAVEADLHTAFFLKSVQEPGPLLRSGKIIHSGRNRLALVRIPVSKNRSIEAVLKEFRSSGFGRLKSLFVRSKALKAWRGARALAARSIPTPRPLAYLEKRKAGMAVEGYFLAERLGKTEEVRDLFRRLAPDDLDRLLRPLGRFLADVHRCGILHKDLSDGNVLAAGDGRGGHRFSLLDTNRVRVRKSVRGLRAAGNLVRLGVPPAAQEAFLRYYAGDRPVSKGFRFWYRFRKAWYAAAVSLKKRLRLRKLAQRLGVQ